MIAVATGAGGAAGCRAGAYATGPKWPASEVVCASPAWARWESPKKSSMVKVGE